VCLAVPARVLSVDAATDTAVVELSGVRSEVSTALLAELAPGDYVLVHVGFALQRLDQEEAARTLALFAEMQSAEDGTNA